MKRPHLSALKSWSVGQLSLVILAGILSVWLMGALAYGLVANIGLTPEPSARSVPTTSQSVGLVPERDEPSPSAPVATSSPANQAVIASASFSIECSQPKAIPPQSADSFDCQVNSKGGFAQPIAISCANVPSGLNCEPEPSIVTPAPNRSSTFKLSLTNYDVAPGRHQFKVVGSVPGASAVFNFPFDTSALAPAPSGSPAASGRVNIQCATGSTRLIPGQSINYKCSYSSEGFYATVATSCTGTVGITCDINPRSVTPRDGQPAETILSLNVAPNLSSAGNNQVIGVFGDPTGGTPRAIHKFTVDVPAPDYAMTCADKTADVALGETASVKCKVSSASGYVGPLHLKLLTVDANGPKATVSPASVQVGAGGTAEVAVTFEAEPSVTPASYRYALGVHADENESFTAATGDTPHNVTLTVGVTAPSPSPSPSTTSSPEA